MEEDICNTYNTIYMHICLYIFLKINIKEITNPAEKKMGKRLQQTFRKKGKPQ